MMMSPPHPTPTNNTLSIEFIDLSDTTEAELETSCRRDAAATAATTPPQRLQLLASSTTTSIVGTTDGEEDEDSDDSEEEDEIFKRERNVRPLSSVGSRRRSMGSSTCATPVVSISSFSQRKQRLAIAQGPCTCGGILCIALHSMSFVTRLVLGGCNLRDDGVARVARVLHEHAPVLTSLNLYFNQITSDGVAAIADAFGFDEFERSEQQIASQEAFIEPPEPMPPLQSLHLAWNEIEDDGALHICRLIRTHPTLQEVGLSHNMISNLGALSVRDTLRNHACTVHTVHIDGNDVSEEISLQVQAAAMRVGKDMMVMSMTATTSGASPLTSSTGRQRATSIFRSPTSASPPKEQATTARARVVVDI
eukprot:PhM_4_TR12531/c0_g1_i1/m.17252